MNKLKILCLNCFGSPISLNKKLRFRLIAEEISKIEPDIVMLQEVIFKSDRKTLENILLKDNYSFYPSNHFNFKNGGLLVLVRNVKVLVHRFYKFNEQGPINVLSLTDRFLGKGVQVLRIKIGETFVNLINTHLLCKYKQTEKDNKAFGNQIEELLDRLKELRNQKVILGGDINTTPNSGEIVKITKTLSLKDYFPKNKHTVSPDNLNRGRVTKIFSDAKPYRTDYILFSHSIKNIKTELAFEKTIYNNGTKMNLSDHFGILSEFEI